MKPVHLLSPSAATDAAWYAAADVAHIADDLGIRYRLIGGIAVTLLTHHYGVADQLPPRETADADFGAPREVYADDRLRLALLDRGYKRERGNRFVYPEGKAARTIDILGPASGTRIESNERAGNLTVDLVPGLRQALLLAPVTVTVYAVLTDGVELNMTLQLPDVIGALILKAFAYQGRFEDRDAIDVWRLLVTAQAAGKSITDWPDRQQALEAAARLHQSFGNPAAPGPRRATHNTREQARIRLLVQRLVPRA